MRVESTPGDLQLISREILPAWISGSGFTVYTSLPVSAARHSAYWVGRPAVMIGVTQTVLTTDVDIPLFISCGNDGSTIIGGTNDPSMLSLVKKGD